MKSLVSHCNIVGVFVYNIYNLILKTSTFLEIWKNAAVHPIFKEGKINDIENYRPIALLRNFPKVLDALLYRCIYDSISFAISEFQHGFVSKRSTVSNLTYFSCNGS